MKYDKIIEEDLKRIESLLSDKPNARLLNGAPFSFRHNGLISKSVLKKFIKEKTKDEPELWQDLMRQLNNLPGKRNGNTSVLLPVYNEPVQLVERAVKAARMINGEVILLVNNGFNDDPKIIQQNKAILALDFFKGKNQVDGAPVYVLDATQGFKKPGIGSARNMLLVAEAFRLLGNPEYEGSNHTLGRKVIMTDCDCEISSELDAWLDVVFKTYPETISIPLNIEFSAENDQALSEGVSDTSHLTKLMLGEFIRNIFVAAGKLESTREERCWIGMGMVFTMQAAVAVGGFPAGWQRKEDHYIGAMFELLERLKFGTIYVPAEEAPSIISIIRGSKRTDASMGKSMLHCRGQTGLQYLEELVEFTSVQSLEENYSQLDYERRKSIFRMPTTKLLFELFKTNGAELPDMHHSEICRTVYNLLLSSAKN